MKRGFTLIELLAVAIIIAILGSIIVGVSNYVSKKAKITKAYAEMHEFANRIENYYAKNLMYPPMDNHFGNKCCHAVDLCYDNSDGIDPWGNPYRYYAYDTVSGVTTVRQEFAIFSLGPDGAVGKKGVAGTQLGDGDDLCVGNSRKIRGQSFQ